MVSEKLTSHIEPPPISSRRNIRCQKPIKGRKMTLWNRAEGTIDFEGNEGKRIMEGKASSHPGQGKEIVDDSNPEEEHLEPHQRSRLKWYSQSGNFHTLRG